MTRILFALALLLGSASVASATEWPKPAGDECLPVISYDVDLAETSPEYRACLNGVEVDLTKCPDGGYGITSFLNPPKHPLDIAQHGTRERAELALRVNRSASASACANQ